MNASDTPVFVQALDKADIVETPSQGSDIKFATWRLLKQDYITVGRISDAGGGMVKVDYELWDVNRQQSLLAQSFTAPTGDLRGVAHQIADQIYEKITGVRGATGMGNSSGNNPTMTNTGTIVMGDDGTGMGHNGDGGVMTNRGTIIAGEFGARVHDHCRSIEFSEIRMGFDDEHFLCQTGCPAQPVDWIKQMVEDPKE